MQDIDAFDIDGDRLFEADVCIVGGGAAGIEIAGSFLDTRYEVVVPESGGH